MLTFNLKKEWYDKIRSGQKTVEYREVKKFWGTRLLNAKLGELFSKKAVPCILRLGYTKHHMTAVIKKIEIVNGKDTDLHINSPVYAIHLADIQERR